MESAWTETGPTVLPPPGSVITSWNSNTTEAGQVQPVTLRQPSLSSAVHAYPQARLDVPIGSTPVQSPVVYQDPSTGQWVQVPSNATNLSSFNSVPDARLEGFIAEAWGTCQSAKVVDVSQCVSGISGLPPVQPMQARDASMSTKWSNSLLKLQCHDGSDSLETFLLKFQHLAMYLKWNEEDQFHHLCASLEGPAGQVLWELPPNTTTADLECLLQTRFGTELQAESFKAKLRTRCRDKGESLQDLYRDIGHLLQLAYPGADGLLVNHVGIESFVSMLSDRDLSTRFSSRTPQVSRPQLTTLST